MPERSILLCVHSELLKMFSFSCISLSLSPSPSTFLLICSPCVLPSSFSTRFCYPHHLPRICLVNGVALQGQLSCDFDPTNITNTTCHPNNTFLQDVFNDTFYSMRDGWEPESSPTCIDGIPGITVAQTFPGEQQELMQVICEGEVP